MKKFLRIGLILFGAGVLTVVAVYFVVTNGSFQKWVVRNQLPVGSQVSEVRITPGKASLSGLVVALEDGTRIALASLEVDYSLRAALFSKTIRIGSLDAAGLELTMGEPTRAETEAKSTSAEQYGDLLEGLYDIAGAGWRYEIAELKLDGVLTDGSGRRYSATIESEGIAPGIDSEIRISLKMTGMSDHRTGLATLTGDALIHLRQGSQGGFDRLRTEVRANGTDAAGNAVLDLMKRLSVEVDTKEARAALDFDLTVDWPRPEIFAPDFAAIGAVAVEMRGSAFFEDTRMTLDAFTAKGASGGADVLNIDLLQPLQVGTKLPVHGVILRLALTKLPLTWLNPWLNPWLPEEARIFGAPVNAGMTLSSSDDGTFLVQSTQPINLGPFSLLRTDEPVLQALEIRLNPRFTVAMDQSVRFTVDDLSIGSPRGVLLSGNVGGSVAATGDIAVLGEFGGSLPALLAQPVNAGKSKLADGIYQLKLNYDAGRNRLLRTSGSLSRLRSGEPGPTLPEIRFTNELKEAVSGSWTINSTVECAGPGTDSDPIHATGTLDTTGTVPEFSVELTSARINVPELSALAAALGPPEAPAGTPKPESTHSPDAPPWAGASGTFKFLVEALVLDSGATIQRVRASGSVNEPTLLLREFRADLGDGSVEGNGSLNFDRGTARPYRVAFAMDAARIEASFFGSGSKHFPVSGKFDATVRLAGTGRSVEAALDAMEGEIRVSGKEGVVSAFELDQRGELGLVGAGILGTALNRPGLTALAQAVPYFKDIRFNEFLLELGRGSDRRVNLSALRILGDSLRIEGSGSVEATRLRNALQAPLDLTLALAAKGKLAEYLDRLKLLEPVAGADGFRNWSRSLKIAGTLRDPDTSALEKVLTRAATSVIETAAPAVPAAGPAGPPDDADTTGQLDAQPPAGAARPSTKEEKRVREIEQGLKLIESLF